MSLIANYWARSECIWMGCEEPPEDGRDTCERHHNCRMSSTASWLESEAS